MASARIVDHLRSLAAALDERDIEYALIGGLALGPRGYPRAQAQALLLVEGFALPAPAQEPIRHGELRL